MNTTNIGESIESHLLKESENYKKKNSIDSNNNNNQDIDKLISHDESFFHFVL